LAQFLAIEVWTNICNLICIKILKQFTGREIEPNEQPGEANQETEGNRAFVQTSLPKSAAQPVEQPMPVLDECVAAHLHFVVKRRLSIIFVKGRSICRRRGMRTQSWDPK
jgi:hypothetical protein